MVEQVLDAHPAMWARYHAGEEKVAKFLMGAAMRALRGQGDPAVVQRVLAERLAARRGDVRRRPLAAIENLNKRSDSAIMVSARITTF